MIGWLRRLIERVRRRDPVDDAIFAYAPIFCMAFDDAFRAKLDGRLYEPCGIKREAWPWGDDAVAFSYSVGNVSTFQRPILVKEMTADIASKMGRFCGECAAAEALLNQPGLARYRQATPSQPDDAPVT